MRRVSLEHASKRVLSVQVGSSKGRNDGGRGINSILDLVRQLASRLATCGAEIVGGGMEPIKPRLRHVVLVQREA